VGVETRVEEVVACECRAQRGVLLGHAAVRLLRARLAVLGSVPRGPSMIRSAPRGVSMTRSAPRGVSMAGYIARGPSMAGSAPRGVSMADRVARGVCMAGGVARGSSHTLARLWQGDGREGGGRHADERRKEQWQLGEVGRPVHGRGREHGRRISISEGSITGGASGLSAARSVSGHVAGVAATNSRPPKGIRPVSGILWGSSHCVDTRVV
jgi:hypothetical protein